MAFFIDPANNYTWWEAENNKAVIAEYREATTQEGDAVAAAAEVADWRAVMRSLVALRKIHFPGA